MEKAQQVTTAPALPHVCLPVAHLRGGHTAPGYPMTWIPHQADGPAPSPAQVYDGAKTQLLDAAKTVKDAAFGATETAAQKAADAGGAAQVRVLPQHTSP